MYKQELEFRIAVDAPAALARAWVSDNPGRLPIEWPQQRAVQVLALDLRSYCVRTLIVAVQLLSVTDYLRGRSEADRYRYFIESLTDSASPLSKFVFRQWPRLKITCDTVCDRNARHLEQVFGALKVDWHLLELDRQPQFLGNLDFGLAGDAHNRRSRTVSVRVSEGSDTRYYKPRPDVADVLYESACHVVSTAVDISIPTATTIARDSYHWAYISEKSRSCRADEATKFGAHLAICFALDIADMHAENFVMSPTGPVAIDVECVGASIPARQWSAKSSFYSGWWNTVDSIGIIPTRPAPDRPLVGAVLDHQHLAHPRPPVYNFCRDGTPQVSLKENPHWDDEGKYYPSRQVEEGVVIGFLDACSALKNNPDLLMQAALIGQRWGRVVVRSTGWYNRVLISLSYPSTMEEGFDLEGEVWKIMNKQRSNVPPEIVEAEVSSLCAGEIPYFRMHDLRDCGLDSSTVSKQLGALQHRLTTCARQERVIRRSFRLLELSNE